MLSGCSSLLPQKRTESVSATESISTEQQAVIEKIVEPSKAADGTIPGQAIRAEFSTLNLAGAVEAAKASVSVPLMVSVALGCVSLGFLLLIWILFSKLSAFGRASDQALGGMTRSIRSMASIAEPAMKAQLHDLLAQCEKERGKLR